MIDRMSASSELLRRYVISRDEDAFRQVVAQYFNYVHGIALRRLAGDSTRALDVVQSVFTDLALKGHKLRDDTQLGGWLHRHTCFIASNLIRSESRRAAREQNAAQMQTTNQLGDDPWSAIAPIIDEVLEDLTDDERSAILLRYFEGRDLRSIGEILRVSEDAAQKRVHRALERLKSLLQQKGVAVSSLALGSILLANASPTLAAPPIDDICESATSNHQSGSGSSLPVTAQIALVICLLAVVFLFITRSKTTVASNQNNSTITASQQVHARPNPQPATPDLSAAPAPSPSVNSAQSSNPSAIDETLRMLVTDASTKLPIPHPKVRISNGRPPQPSTSFVEGDTLIVGDEKGVALIPLANTRKDRLMLQTYADDHADWISIWDKSKGETVPSEYSVALEPGVPLGGRVLDQDNNPVLGAEVRFGITFRSGAMVRSSQRAENRALTNITDATGAFLDTHIPESVISGLSLSVSHPEFVKTTFLTGSDSIAQLRARSFTIKLSKGLNVAGRVTTQNGEPVTNGLVSYGRRSYVHRLECKTDAEGRYLLKNISPEAFPRENIFSVVAPGFAAATQQLPTNPTTNELNFVLEPGGIIRGRVVNTAGEPLSNIRVIREILAPSQQDGIEWHVITGDDGRFFWDGAPNSPQNFYFGAPGYVEIRNRLLTPQNENYEIVLQKPQTIKGAVTDALTGVLIPKFSLTLVQVTTSSTLPSGGIEQEFKNGAFETTLINGFNFIRIRAPGYLTALFPISSDNKVFAQLNQSTALEGIVLDNDGRPVARAEIASVPADSRSGITVGKGRLVTDDIGDRTRTDDLGYFKLTLSAQSSGLLAIHPDAGFAEIQLADLAATNTLRLQRWAQIEGILLTNNLPFPNQEISLRSFGGVQLDYRDFKNAKTDAAGRFTFDRLPPIPLMVLHRDIFPSGPPGQTIYRNGPMPAQTHITPAPGVITYLELDAAKVPQFPTNHPPTR
jgi:RNA polymerase sigma factor (sigma-70 family)